MNTINLKEKFSRFSDYCNPRVIGKVNDCHVKAVKLKGEFIWHHHENEDELFLAELMAWHRKSLGELLAVLSAECGEFHYGRVDLDVKPGQKEKAIAHFSNAKLDRILDLKVVRREDMDGIKLYLGEAGWVMVRASGTENVLRIYSETANPETTRRILEAVSQMVHNL